LLIKGVMHPRFHAIRKPCICQFYPSNFFLDLYMTQFRVTKISKSSTTNYIKTNIPKHLFNWELTFFQVPVVCVKLNHAKRC